MKVVAAVLVLASLAAAEAPQEHSHEAILRVTDAMLNISNPLGIEGAVFGLLGDAAAKGGAGNVANIKCLQQNTADQAFSNSKASNNINGMANALMYRALQRNFATLGGATELCDEVAVNPEIGAISQHQDPASAEAAAGANRKIALDLATQLNALGVDPNLAIQTGTFPAGVIGDSTGDGFICDDSDDAVGCIFTTNMLVADVTEAEIAAHLAGQTVSLSNVVAAAPAQADEARLLELADTVNATKQAADLQGEANTKGTIFAIGAQLAAAHPNAADAQKAIAAAMSAAGQVAAVSQDATTVRCETAVRQSIQQSDNAGRAGELDEATGIAACVAAQQAQTV